MWISRTRAQRIGHELKISIRRDDNERDVVMLKFPAGSKVETEMNENCARAATQHSFRSSLITFLWRCDS